jgi:hypothetical protein
VALLAGGCSWHTRRSFGRIGPEPNDHGLIVRVRLASFARGSDPDAEASSYRFFLSATAFVAKSPSTSPSPSRSAQVTGVRLFRVDAGQRTEIALPPLTLVPGFSLETLQGFTLPRDCLDVVAVIVVLVTEDGAEVSRTFEVPLHRSDDSRLGG